MNVNMSKCRHTMPEHGSVVTVTSRQAYGCVFCTQEELRAALLVLADAAQAYADVPDIAETERALDLALTAARALIARTAP